jgi:nitrite reductase (NADH) large subunit
MGGAGTEAITLSDPDAGVYRKIVLKNDRVAGAVFYGDTASAGWTLDLMREQRDVTPFRDTLAFGPEAVARLQAETEPAPPPAATSAVERKVA